MKKPRYVISCRAISLMSPLCLWCNCIRLSFVLQLSHLHIRRITLVLSTIINGIIRGIRNLRENERGSYNAYINLRVLYNQTTWSMPGFILSSAIVYIIKEP